MFFFSKCLSLVSKALEIPVNEDSMKRTLLEQMDFTIEQDNLEIFNEHFKNNKEVRFPLPFQSATTDSILV